VDERAGGEEENTGKGGGRMGLANGGYGISWGPDSPHPLIQGPIGGTPSTPFYVLWLEAALRCPSLGR